MIIKSHLIEQDISIIDKYKCVLIYGENEGLKKEIIEKIKQIKNTEIIDLFDQDLNNSNSFEIQTVNLSLFQKKKIIIIYNPKELFLNRIKESVEYQNDFKLIILSGLLTKKSNIRSFCEQEKNIITIPCYNDTKFNLANLIKSQLKQLNGLTPTIINQILEKTENERQKVKEEIDKIKLYFFKKKLNENEIEKLLNYNLEIDIPQLVNDILIKNLTKLNNQFDQLDVSREEVFIFFSIITNLLEKVKFILLNTEQNQITQSVLTKLNIKIFWKEQNTFLTICNKLNLKTIENLQTICFKNETLIKKNYDIDYLPVFKKTILELIKN